METYLAAAYWGPRREPVEACAARAVTFLTTLSQVSECFRGWRPLGRSRSDAIRTPPIDLSISGLVKLFMMGRNRRDVGGAPIEDLGFRISVWNGKGDEEVSSLTMKCGLYSTVSGLSNAIVLKLPTRFGIDSTEHVKQLIVALGHAWDPDWAIVASQSNINRQSGAGPFLDKTLYVRASITVPINLRDAVQPQGVEEGLLFLA